MLDYAMATEDTPMIRYVCGFVFSPDKKLVSLIEKKKPKWQAGLWNGIGGKMKEGELPEEAMTREFKEEAGVYCSQNCWTEIVTLRGDDWECTFFYHMTPLVIQVQTMETERVAIHDPMNLPKVIFNLNWLIPLAMDDDVLKPLGIRGIPLTEAALGGKLVPKPD